MSTCFFFDTSALVKLYHEEAIAAFQSDLSQFHVITVESTIMARASDLLKTAGLKNALKTLDSLQLASALVFSERSKLDLFIAADGVLMKNAEETGLKVMAA